MKPSAPNKEGNATCRNRSPVRSEFQPTSNIPSAAAIYGTAENNPTSTSLYPDNPLTMVGTQKVRP